MKKLTTHAKLLPVAFAGVLALTACDAGFSSTKDDSEKKTTVTVEQTTPSPDASKADEDVSNGGPNPTGKQETNNETSAPENDNGSPTTSRNPEPGQAPDVSSPVAPSQPQPNAQAVPPQQQAPAGQAQTPPPNVPVKPYQKQPPRGNQGASPNCPAYQCGYGTGQNGNPNLTSGETQLLHQCNSGQYNAPQVCANLRLKAQRAGAN